MLQCFLPFLSVWNRSPWESPTHIQDESSFLGKTPWKPSHVRRYVSTEILNAVQPYKSVASKYSYDHGGQ